MMERVLPLPRVEFLILTSRREKIENATITAFSLLKAGSMLQGGIFVKPVSQQVVCTCGEDACQNFCTVRVTCGQASMETTCSNILSAKIVRFVKADTESIDAKTEDPWPRVTE